MLTFLASARKTDVVARVFAVLVPNQPTASRFTLRSSGCQVLFLSLQRLGWQVLLAYYVYQLAAACWLRSPATNKCLTATYLCATKSRSLPFTGDAGNAFSMPVDIRLLEILLPRCPECHQSLRSGVRGWRQRFEVPRRQPPGGSEA